MFTEEVAYSTAYIAGLLSFFSPCIFPIIPVYISILSNGEKKSVSKTLAFVFGLSITYIVLGFGADYVRDVFFNDKVRIIGGILVIILGLFQVDILKLKFLEKTKMMNYEGQDQSIISTFILGVTFSFGWTPCVGPVLSSVLAIAASGGNGAWQGGLLMLVYTLGLAIPFLILAFASSIVLRHFGKIKPYMSTLKKIGGALIILMGILLMLGNFNVLASIFGG